MREEGATKRDDAVSGTREPLIFCDIHFALLPVLLDKPATLIPPTFSQIKSRVRSRDAIYNGL